MLINTWRHEMDFKHRESCKILKERRTALGLTQKQVADRAGIKWPQYQKFELGTRDIMNASYELASRVILALEMDIADFYHGEYTKGQ